MMLFTKKIHVSPLHEACRTNQHELANSLIRTGAPLETICKLSVPRCLFSLPLTPLQVACGNGCFETASLLLNLGANPDFKGGPSIHTTSLILAARGRHLDVVQLLLIQHKVDLEVVDSMEDTALMVAVRNNHFSVVQFLLEHGSRIEYPSRYSWKSTFNQACALGHLEITKLMLDRYGVQIDGSERSSMTPLTSASNGGQIAVVKLLLDRGADINKRDSERGSSIAYALYFGHTELADLLLKNGATASDVDKLTALNHTCFNGGPIDMFDLLISLNTQVDVWSLFEGSPIQKACRGGNKDIVKKLLPLVERCDLSNQNGMTPLLIACGRGQTEIVEMLLARNVDVNRISDCGYTPLGRACEFGDGKMVELLLSAGASIKEPKKYKKMSRSHYSTEGKPNRYLTSACLCGNIETAAVLVSRGARANASVLQGKPVFEWYRCRHTPLQCLFFAVNYRFVLLYQMAWMTLCAKRVLVKQEPPQSLHSALRALFQSEPSWPVFQMIFKKLPLEHIEYLRS